MNQHKVSDTDQGFVLMLMGGPSDGTRIKANVRFIEGDRVTWAVSGLEHAPGSYAAIYVARTAYPQKGWELLHYVGKELPE